MLQCRCSLPDETQSKDDGKKMESSLPDGSLPFARLLSDWASNGRLSSKLQFDDDEESSGRSPFAGNCTDEAEKSCSGPTNLNRSAGLRWDIILTRSLVAGGMGSVAWANNVVCNGAGGLYIIATGDGNSVRKTILHVQCVNASGVGTCIKEDCAQPINGGVANNTGICIQIFFFFHFLHINSPS